MDRGCVFRACARAGKLEGVAVKPDLVILDNNNFDIESTTLQTHHTQKSLSSAGVVSCAVPLLVLRRRLGRRGIFIGNDGALARVSCLILLEVGAVLMCLGLP